MHPVPSPMPEVLLTPEGRADLPLGRIVRLYLDPGALFKDASRGSRLERQQARCYNERHRWLLLCYIRRWMTIALLLLGGVAGAESLGPEQAGLIYVAASFAVASCIAVTASFQMAIGYLLLRPESDRSAPR